MGREKYPPLNSHGPLSRQGKTVVALVRVCVLLSILACVVWRDIIQSCINVTWSYLLTTWWFNTVYFETGWATVIYAIIISVYPFALHFIRWFDRFKVHPSVTYIHQVISLGKMCTIFALTCYNLVLYLVLSCQSHE